MLRVCRAVAMSLCVGLLLCISFFSSAGQSLSLDFLKWLVGVSPSFVQHHARSLWHDIPVVLGGSGLMPGHIVQVSEANNWAAAVWLPTLLVCLVLSSAETRVDQALREKHNEQARSSGGDASGSESIASFNSDKYPTSSPASIRDHFLWLALLWSSATAFDGEAAGVVAVGAALDGMVLLARLVHQSVESSVAQHAGTVPQPGTAAGTTVDQRVSNGQEATGSPQSAYPESSHSLQGVNLDNSTDAGPEGCLSVTSAGSQVARTGCAHPRTIGSLVTVASTLRLCVFSAAFVSRARVFPTLVTLRLLAKHRASAPWLLCLAGASAVGWLRDWTLPHLLLLLFYVGLAVVAARFVLSYLRLAQSEAALRQEVQRAVHAIRGTRAAMRADEASVLRRLLQGRGRGLGAANRVEVREAGRGWGPRSDHDVVSTSQHGSEAATSDSPTPSGSAARQSGLSDGSSGARVA